MRTLFCPPPLSVSGAIIMSSPCIFPPFLPSTETPPSKKKKKKNWNYPTPSTALTPCVSLGSWGTAPPPAPHSEHAFLEGSLLFIPSGGLTVNLLHWGEISGSEANVCGYSKWTSIHLTIQPNTNTPSCFFFPPLSLLSARIAGLASSSFHFQPRQAERLH